MDIFLIITACVLCLAAIVGCLIPVLPGPPLAYAGLLLAAMSRFASFGAGSLVLWGAVTAAVTVLDYVLPVWITRQLGGSKYAAWGTAAGVIAGLLFLPWGIVLGPFLGALAGELIHDSRGGARAFRVAIGSFLAFILGTGAKLAVVGVMCYMVCKALIFSM